MTAKVYFFERSLYGLFYASSEWYTPILPCMRLSEQATRKIPIYKQEKRIQSNFPKGYLFESQFFIISAKFRRTFWTLSESNSVERKLEVARVTKKSMGKLSGLYPHKERSQKWQVLIKEKEMMNFRLKRLYIIIEETQFYPWIFLTKKSAFCWLYC